MTISKFQEYKELLSLTYDNAVEHLLQKYGPAKDDYYREKSYKRFFNEEIKSITKGKITRTKEGLYCHHIDENKALKLSNESWIKKQNIPFDYHKKDRLVYCDLIEHSILHALIAKETNFEFGIPGYEVFLIPNIEDWYIDKDRTIPGGWRAKCYEKAYLEPQEAIDIIREMQLFLGDDYYKTVEGFNEKKNYMNRQQKTILQMMREQREKELPRWIAVAKSMDDKSPRKNILECYYHIKFLDDDETLMFADDFKPYELKMKKYPKDTILRELIIYINSLEDADGKID